MSADEKSALNLLGHKEFRLRHRNLALWKPANGPQIRTSKKRFYPSGQCSTVWRQSLRTVAWLNFASVNGIVQERESLDVIRNKGYNSRMMTYATLQSDRREFLALTGLTLQEFQLLLNAFTPAYERRYPKDRTLADRPRQRCAGGGRKGDLDCPEQKLLYQVRKIRAAPVPRIVSIGQDRLGVGTTPGA